MYLATGIETCIARAGTAGGVSCRSARTIWEEQKKRQNITQKSNRTAKKKKWNEKYTKTPFIDWCCIFFFVTLGLPPGSSTIITDLFLLWDKDLEGSIHILFFCRKNKKNKHYLRHIAETMTFLLSTQRLVLVDICLLYNFWLEMTEY